MSEALVIVLGLILLLAACAIWLWQWSAQRQARLEATQHLEHQLRTQIEQASQADLLSRQDLAHRDNASEQSLLKAAPVANASHVAGVATEAVPTALHMRTHQVLPGWLRGGVSTRTLALGAGMGVLIWLVSTLMMGWLAGVLALVLYTLLAIFMLWMSVQRFRRKLVGQLPSFIDTMVRMITIGNSTQSAFQNAIASTQAPLRDYLERASNLMRGGAELDQALLQMARQVRVEEMHLLAAILGLGVRYGGRADVLLERVANFMRDRDQAERELVALSAETRLSAWILALLPVVVGLAIIMLNAGYFTRMWVDPAGRQMIFGAAALQILGVLLLYRLARLS